MGVSTPASLPSESAPTLVDQLVAVRPFAYHVTARCNLPAITRRRALLPAADLLRGANKAHLINRRRRGTLPLVIAGEEVWLRDQDRLSAGAIVFEEGWDLPSFCALLNSLVFFWPGTSAGPIRQGVNYLTRYAHESPAVLRVPMKDLLTVHATSVRFSHCNSGAPRAHPTAGKCPRGARTFLPPELYGRTARTVVEVVVQGRAERLESASWWR